MYSLSTSVRLLDLLPEPETVPLYRYSATTEEQETAVSGSTVNSVNAKARYAVFLIFKFIDEEMLWKDVFLRGDMICLSC